MTLPQEDLDAVTDVLSANGGGALRGQTIFVTGGTGFLGRWLVETFAAFNRRASLGARMVLLTRDAKRFHSDDPALSVVEGDVETLDERKLPGHCDSVIAGATPSAAELAAAPPERVAAVVDGVRRTLDYAVRAGAKRFLYLSSGAVYGSQPPEISHLPEDYAGTPLSPYGESKRAGEQLCARYHEQFGLHSVIARGFTFVGPHIPLDAKFAAGQFIGNALQQSGITVSGDGTPVRSYLYTADFAAWSWVLLLNGQAGRAYNVGSESEVTIGELAREAARLTNPPLPVRIAGWPDSSRPVSRYVPSTARARGELGLRETVDWHSALRKTYQWYAQQLAETTS